MKISEGDMMRYFVNKASKVMAELSGWSLGAIMIFILVDIISRYIGKPVAGAGEMAIFAMIVAVFLGLSYCEERQNHVRVELLYHYLPSKYVNILNLLSYFLVFLMAGVVTYAIGIYLLSVYYTKEAIQGPKPILIFPVIFLMFIGYLIYWMQILLNLIEAFRKFNMKT